MSDFWQGLTYGALGGAILTLSLCIRIIRSLINLHKFSEVEYGHDIKKYKRYTDAEVLRIVRDGADNSEEVIENLSDDQLDRLLAQVTDEDVKDELEMEKLARTIDDD